MNKKNIIEHLMNKNYNPNVYSKLMEDMENAKMEISVARSMFNNVNDDKLIEVAIYSENVARKRYDYLLSIAREIGISVGYEYIVEKSVQIAE
ncbi:MAG: YaaL family protein [Clostridium sp.]|uniref:YaaL family protein n=1 Tax=Clostridium sp. TaxID=1506 RepID=UPI0025C519AC|nr:YaaL family protein [Clostridium sp.]MCE5221749.1 YaaL family protein [Clostridium sp.]